MAPPTNLSPANPLQRKRDVLLAALDAEDTRIADALADRLPSPARPEEDRHGTSQPQLR